MPARLRKLIGLFGILGFLAAYVVAVIAVGEHVASHWGWQTVFYGLAGILWGVPLFPLITWMNRGP
jgi:sugar phosphate permease